MKISAGLGRLPTSSATFGLLGCLLLSLAGCISGLPDKETYTDSTGTTTVIQSDHEKCESACNDNSARCMDTEPAHDTGVNGPPGMFGASADCRNDLKSCLSSCKGS